MRSRTSAYSEDLRWRMVFQHELKGISYNSIARNLNVDASTVRRTVDLFWATGDVQKRPYLRSAANARQKQRLCATLHHVSNYRSTGNISARNTRGIRGRPWNRSRHQLHM